MPLLHALAALVLALALAPSAALASTTVYDTFALADGDTDAIVGQFNNNDIQLAYSFVVPPGTGTAPLETVTVRIRHSPDPTLGKGDFTVLLREDDGGQPGAVLESWTFTGLVPSETNVQFDSVAQPFLTEGSTYWLNMKIEAGTGAGLWIAAEPRTTDVLAALTGGLNPVWVTPAVFPYLTGFASVVVPEPAHVCLLLAGAAVLAPFRRRRARA